MRAESTRSLPDAVNARETSQNASPGAVMRMRRINGRNPYRMRELKPPAPVSCTSCGQTAHTRTPDLPAICARCRDELRAPQGEQWRLFAPAPGQFAGQTDLGL
jgi:hypothetical protein